MRLLAKPIGFIFCLFSVLVATSQEVGTTGNEHGFILKREYSAHAFAHSEGMGFGMRWGQYNSYNSQRYINFDLLNMKHPKEIKMGNVYMFDNARKFVYGKQNSVLMMRFGLGSMNVLNEKPYWGGVDVRRFYEFGASIAMAKPVYLYIIDQSSSTYTYHLNLERYNPEEHNILNIFGRGPMLKGVGESKIYPGLYFKGGFSFEYGPERRLVRYVETGVAVDLYLKKIPIMALAENTNYFISFYVAANFGKRYNP